MYIPGQSVIFNLLLACAAIQITTARSGLVIPVYVSSNADAR